MPPYEDDKPEKIHIEIRNQLNIAVISYMS